MSEWIFVDGENKGTVQLYALSTCVWCKKTKTLLNEKGVQYQYIDIDLLDKDEKQKIKDSLKKFNVTIRYPTVIINDSVCIVGYEIEKLEKELEI